MAFYYIILLAKYKLVPQDYQVDNTSWRVLKNILGLAKLANQWNGIKVKD